MPIDCQSESESDCAGITGDEQNGESFEIAGSSWRWV